MYVQVNMYWWNRSEIYRTIPVDLAVWVDLNAKPGHAINKGTKDRTKRHTTSTFYNYLFTQASMHSSMETLSKAVS